MQNPDSVAAVERPWWQPRLKPTLWTLVGLLAFCILVMGVSAFVAKASVDALTSDAKALVAEIGDTNATAARVDDMRSSARVMHVATAHPIWRASEVLPLVGDDLRAVRLLASAADTLVADVAAPLLEFDLSAIGPKDGALNVDAVAQLGKKIERVAPIAEQTRIRLIAEGIDTARLLPALREPVKAVSDSLESITDTLNRVATISPQLPTMLGADEPRDYLVLVQNTAEMRSLGGNPAILLMLTLEQGRMEITQTASRYDVNSGRDTPIAPLNLATESLYTDRVGKWLQDTTMTPDFTQTAHLVRAFWQETLGDPGDAVLSIDPVALGYFLDATGPIETPSGATLNSNNAAEILLNKVYYWYPGGSEESGRQQDAFFASVAASVFDGLTHVDGGLGSLIPSLVKSFEERRILYASTDASEAKAVAGTALNGPLYETSNRSKTQLGVFVNDNTEGKLDYYTNMALRAETDLCSAPTELVSFTLTADYNYTLDPNEVDDLPYYISTARYFPKGVKSTNLVFYGPAGSTFVAAKVDGRDYVPHAGATDLGRSAVRVQFEQDPSTSKRVEVTFTAPAEQHYGALDIVHTPMLENVPVIVDAPGCG